jgi:hypothetical protein
MADFRTDVLAELISGKHQCLVQLRDMGRRQAELIEEGNMTGLLELLTAKQRHLEQLRQIERGLDPFRDQDPEGRRWRTIEDRRRCSKQTEECERLLAEIIDREKQSEGVLLRRRDEAATRLQSAHMAERAREAYTEQRPSEVKQIDLLSNT